MLQLCLEPEIKFVEREEFCELAVGFRKLVRLDRCAQGLRGLVDVETGARFFIEERKLFPPLARRSQP